MKRGRYALVLLLVFLGLFPVFFGSRVLLRAISQTSDHKEKLITRENGSLEPFEVLNIKSDQSPIEFGKAQRVDGDWLKGFSIVYRNDTNRKIVCFTLDMVFPETKQTGPRMAYTLSYGLPPISGKKSDKFPVVQPGETLRLGLDTIEHEALKTFIGKRQPLESLTKVDLSISVVYFEDGTAWGGEYLVPDPNKPGRFILPPSQR
jgi:hypothetical protein